MDQQNLSQNSAIINNNPSEDLLEKKKKTRHIFHIVFYIAFIPTIIITGGLSILTFIFTIEDPAYEEILAMLVIFVGPLLVIKFVGDKFIEKIGDHNAKLFYLKFFLLFLTVLAIFWLILVYSN